MNDQSSAPASAASGLFWDVAQQGASVLVRLEGVIDEHNRLQTALAEESGKDVFLHVGGVKRINSCGVRDWIRWLSALEERGNNLYFAQMPPILVGQLNVVRNFTGAKGKVLSFLAPYFCEHCDLEHLERLAPHLLPAEVQPPEVICETCGSAMEFDDIPKSFFIFVRDQRVAPSPEVLKVIDGFEAARLQNTVAALKEVTSGTRGP